MAQKLAFLRRDPADCRTRLQVDRSVPKPAKRQPGTYVPHPQQERIVARHIAGESLSEIARNEGRHRATITKIVKSEQVAEYVGKMRARLYGYSEKAMAAVLAGLNANDHEFAYRLLKDLGIVPSERERLVAQLPEARGEDEKRIQTQMAKLLEVTIERAAVYGTQFPELEDALGEKLYVPK